MQDDRTPKLNLPLPSGQNTLDVDLPRLREAISGLDGHMPLPATQGEVNGGDAGQKYVSPSALAQTTFDASKIDRGVFDLARIPAAALEDMVTVQNDATRFALTSVDVHIGKSVRVLEDADGIAYEKPRLYIVQDLAHLDSEAGYKEYAMVVLWDAVQGKPNVATLEELDAEAEARQAALAAHDGNADAHAALVRRITVGDISPVIGICQIETGNTTGLWYNVDADGQPITPNKRYFDYHPVYNSMRRVLVDGQVMVEIEPFWFQHLKPAEGPFAGKLCRIISPGQQDGFRPYPAFWDAAGEMRKLYIAAFSATDEGSSKAGSRPGKMPLVSLDFPTMRTRCANRNEGGVMGFRLWDIYHYSALCNLFLIEHATPESQMLYGRGWVDSDHAVAVDDEHQPNWRGFTGLWGNVWEMVDGCRLDTSRRIEMFRNDGSQAYVNTGKVAPLRDGGNVAYIVTNHEGGGDGWNMEDGFFPLTQAANRAAGSFGDYFYGYGGTAGTVLYVGGNWGHGSGAGLFCLHLSSPASHSYSLIGCRLAKV
ncbi:MAG: hypothetical protein LBO64_07225 [Desulfovibrio sp.]|jgi:hypothetical protein|nr:hypothetical protein [Desulfovibrio sp.]